MLRLSRALGRAYTFAGLVGSHPVDRASHAASGRYVSLILALRFLVHQVVGGCDIVVTVGLYTLDCVVGIKAELIENLLVDRVIQWHELLSGEEAFWGLVLELLVPGVAPDF